MSKQSDSSGGADANAELCPVTGESDCPMCAGEFCETHGYKPCDCDVVDRHSGARAFRESEKFPVDTVRGTG